MQIGQSEASTSLMWDEAANLRGTWNIDPESRYGIRLSTWKYPNFFDESAQQVMIVHHILDAVLPGQGL